MKSSQNLNQKAQKSHSPCNCCIQQGRLKIYQQSQSLHSEQKSTLKKKIHVTKIKHTQKNQKLTPRQISFQSKVGGVGGSLYTRDSEVGERKKERSNGPPNEPPHSHSLSPTTHPQETGE